MGQLHTCSCSPPSLHGILPKQHHSEHVSTISRAAQLPLTLRQFGAANLSKAGLITGKESPGSQGVGSMGLITGLLCLGCRVGYLLVVWVCLSPTLVSPHSPRPQQCWVSAEGVSRAGWGLPLWCVLLGPCGRACGLSCAAHMLAALFCRLSLAARILILICALKLT